MRTFNYTPPPDELKQLKSGIKQYINKPKGICSWHKGDKIMIEGWREVTVQMEGTTFIYFGLVPEMKMEYNSY